MEKFTFDKRKEVMFPNSAFFDAPKDSKGNELDGDSLIKTMAGIADKWVTKNKCPVPIPDQKFIVWLRQTRDSLNAGKSSEEIFKQTLVGR